jgi:membrane-bound ClpP family serine protease
VRFVVKVSLLGLFGAVVLIIGLAMMVSSAATSGGDLGPVALVWILASPFIVVGSVFLREVVLMTRERTAGRK